MGDILLWHILEMDLIMIYEASKPGVAGWVRKCPAKGHTTCHEYSGLTYDPKYGGNGRVYVCRSKGCN